MSLTFDGNGNLTHTWAAAPGLSMTMMAYAKHTGTSGDKFVVCSTDEAADASYLGAYMAGASGRIYASHRTPGSSRAADSGVGIGSGYTACMVHGQTSSPGTRVVAGPSATTVTEASARTARTHTKLRVGANGDTTPAGRWVGDIGEVVVWTGLTETEAQTAFAAIVAGGLPEDQFTANVLDVWDLQTYSAGGTYTGRVNGLVLTSVGSGISQAAAHPISRTPAAPTVTTQPSSSTVTEGATATFTAAFANTPTSFAWEYAVSPYASWSAVSGGSGGTTAAYTTAATTLAMSGRRYRCTATNAGGSVTTNGAAELTVNAPVADLSSPTVTNVGATTATCGFSTDTATGNGYFLRRTGLSAASAATIISTGESQAVGGTGAQTRAMTAFTSGLTYYVDMAQTGSTEVVTAGPFYPGTGRPVSDVDVTGWTASTGSDLWAMLDEDTASDTDYVTSPALSGSATTGSHALDKTYTAGTYSIKVRAKTDTGAGTLAVRLLNGSNVSQGVTADQAITSTWTTYTLPITITGDATRIRYEVVAA